MSGPQPNSLRSYSRESWREEYSCAPRGLKISSYESLEDWWKSTHDASDTPRMGRPSLISDPEVLTLAILAQWPRFRSERDFHRFAFTHLREHFPTLPSQSQFNRRVRALEAEMKALSLHLVGTLAEPSAVYHVLDTTLIPAVVRVTTAG